MSYLFTVDSPVVSQKRKDNEEKTGEVIATKTGRSGFYCAAQFVPPLTQTHTGR